MKLPRKKKVLSVLGTRPEVVKFAPILERLERARPQIQAVNIASGQHTTFVLSLGSLFRFANASQSLGDSTAPNTGCAVPSDCATALAHFGSRATRTLEACFKVLRRFVEAHEDVSVIFPKHPNRALSAPANLLHGHPHIHVIGAMAYSDFVHLMSHAWLIISDSGGIQEEVPTLGKPLLILRRNTERPEALACGTARLAGTSAESLSKALDDSSREESWTIGARSVSNPFGRGDSGSQIVDAIHSLLGTGAN